MLLKYRLVGSPHNSLEMEFTKEGGRFYAYVEMKNGSSVAEIHKKLSTAFPECSPTLRTIRNWCNDFQSGQRVSWTDRDRSGRPRSRRSIELVQSVSEISDSDPRLSLRDMSVSLEVNKETIRQILHENLKKHKICSVWVPYSLTDGHKDMRVACAEGILQLHEDIGEEDMLRRLCTMDETWVSFSPDPWRSDSKVWAKENEPRPRVVQHKAMGRRTMLLVVFSGDGKFYVEGTEKNESVNSERYVSFVKNSVIKFRKDRRRISPKDLLWIHDNARPHSSVLTSDFFVSKNIKLVKQSPYSPDLNQCDRWLFKHLKKCSKNNDLLTSVVSSTTRVLYCDRSLPTSFVTST